MSFDKGNISFRIFYLKNGLSESAIEKFADHVAPPIDTLGTSPIRGWVSWRHLLDHDVSEKTCYFSPWYHVAAMQAEKKVPPKLLKAYCRLEEDVLMRAENLQFVNRKQRAEIKKRVFEQLQPQMPPTLTGLPVVANLRTNFVLAEAMTSALARVSGYSTAQSRTCMPPKLPPTTAKAFLTPSCRRSMRWTVTTSCTVISGNAEP